MKDFSNITNPWKDWKIIRRIGQGSFGSVYEIERNAYGFTEKAALKIISVPSSEDELETLRNSNYDVSKWCRSIISDIFREYALMSQLKQNPNVVRCDDCREVPHEDDEGSDVCIRMELLSSLYRMRRELKEEEVIKLGKDISSALVFCEEKGIIHRDIKPDNILVSDEGVYKLGDFGVAREMDHTTMASLKGTPTFMAPEIEARKEYGMDADVYSLGLVMYWLLNKRRHPFVPTDDTPLASEVQAANIRRLLGETLPDPVNGSRRLKDIILKACAYDRKDRYKSARELLNDLNALENSCKDSSKPKAAEVKSAEETSQAVSTAKPAEEKESRVFVKEDSLDETLGMFDIPTEQEPTVMDETLAGSPDEPEAGLSGDEHAGSNGSGGKVRSKAFSDRKKNNRKPKWVVLAVIAVALTLIASVINMLGQQKAEEMVSGEQSSEEKAAEEQTADEQTTEVRETTWPQRDHGLSFDLPAGWKSSESNIESEDESLGWYWASDDSTNGATFCIYRWDRDSNESAYEIFYKEGLKGLVNEYHTPNKDNKSYDILSQGNIVIDGTESCYQEFIYDSDTYYYHIMIPVAGGEWIDEFTFYGPDNEENRKVCKALIRSIRITAEPGKEAILPEYKETTENVAGISLTFPADLETKGWDEEYDSQRWAYGKWCSMTIVVDEYKDEDYVYIKGAEKSADYDLFKMNNSDRYTGAIKEQITIDGIDCWYSEGTMLDTVGKGVLKKDRHIYTLYIPLDKKKALIRVTLDYEDNGIYTDRDKLLQEKIVNSIHIE